MTDTAITKDCLLTFSEKKPGLIYLNATLPEVRLLGWCFSRFLKCANVSKSYKASHKQLQSVN